jgi:hypothetical protein
MTLENHGSTRGFGWRRTQGPLSSRRRWNGQERLKTGSIVDPAAAVPADREGRRHLSDDRNMRQGQFDTRSGIHPQRWRRGGMHASFGSPSSPPPRTARCRPWVDLDHWLRPILWLIQVLWFFLTLPVRVFLGLLGLLGRVTGVVVGFLLMVFGMALWAGPLFLLGIPLFILGLLLTLRCLG